MSLAIFISEAARVFKAPVAKTISSCADRRGEFVGVRAEGQAGELSDFLCGALGEFGVSVEAGAYGGATDGQIVEAIESDGDAACHHDRAG